MRTKISLLEIEWGCVMTIFTIESQNSCVKDQVQGKNAFGKSNRMIKQFKEVTEGFFGLRIT